MTFRRILDYVVLGLIISGIVFLLKFLGWNDVHGNAIVVDGDSIVLDDQKIRLIGIDAPELKQNCQRANKSDYACGKQARTFLRKLVKSKIITCTQVDTDRYYRAVSFCKIGETDLNLAMIKAGWAVAYRSHSRHYAQAEIVARKQKRGIWQGSFTEPQEWRAQNR